MNVENINKVADAIEQRSIPNLGFNMQSWRSNDRDLRYDKTGHKCGTTACVGGWCEAVFFGGEDTCEAEIRKVLDISYDQSEELFYGMGVAMDATPAQAVRTLRHLAATGKVRWDLPEPSDA